MCAVQCVVGSVLFAVYNGSVNGKFFSFLQAVCSVQCPVYSVQYAVYNVQRGVV